jgi:pimeloyl-ACP methyl ester carboxylesterase
MFTQPIREELVALNDIALNVVQWGDQGSPIICVHGVTANAFSFQAFADELSPTHRVIAYDLRGRGDSDKPDHGYSLSIHAADLAHLIDALGLERPTVIGHSLGAMIALRFAAQYPQKLSKLVLVDAGAPFSWKTPEEQPAWLTNAFGRLGRSIPSYEEYAKNWKTTPYLGNYWNEYIDLYIEHDIYTQDDGSVICKVSFSALLEEATHAHEVKPDKDWPLVQVPTLLLRAGKKLVVDNDQLLTEEAAQAIQQGIASCQYLNYPELNHYTIVISDGREPACAIGRFIDEQV